MLQNPSYLRVAVDVRLVNPSPLMEESVSLKYKRSEYTNSLYLFLYGFVPEVRLAAHSRALGIILTKQFIIGEITPYGT